MKFDQDVQTRYSQLSEQEKEQLSKIYRITKLPQLIAQLCYTITLITYGYNNVWPLITLSHQIGEALFLPELINFFGIAIIGILLVFIIEKISTLIASSKYSFYTEKLAEYHAYIRRER